MMRFVLACICLGCLVAIAVGGCGGGSPASTTDPPNTDVTMSISASLDYSRLTFESMLGHVDAVVEARVVDKIPMQVNEVDPAQLEDMSEEEAPMPIPYRGYKVDVIHWYGGGSPEKEIALYQMVCGQNGEGGLVSPDFAPGDTLLAPISFSSSYGVPLQAGEFWMYHEGMTTYVVKNGQASLTVDLEVRDSRIENRRSEAELLELLSEKGYEEQMMAE
ncbi:MAG: hypothetical protein JXA87_15730 [Thermoleophilia bacterium]|nr:hypothetical protein [Thermoleophilia bacterium]